MDTKPASAGCDEDTDEQQDTKRTQSSEKTPEQLFDFKPLLLTGGIIRTNNHDSFNNYNYNVDDDYSPSASPSPESVRFDPFNMTMKHEEYQAA